MMEAAGYGLPCITRFVLPAGARIRGMDHPGLSGPLIEVTNDADYKARVGDLIGDAAQRQAIGAAMLASVARSNVAPGWCDFMETAYAQALALPRPDGHEMYRKASSSLPRANPTCGSRPSTGSQRPPHTMLLDHLSQLSFRQRLKDWAVIRRTGIFEGPRSLRHALPNGSASSRTRL